MDKVLDDLGLVRENNFLVAYFPASQKALVFRVVARTNSQFERLEYGPLPLKSGDTLATYEGGTVSVPADGVIPSRAYTPDGYMWTPIVTNTYDASDMWYIPTEWKERIFHIILNVTPNHLKLELEFPKGTKQVAFQRDRVLIGVSKDFGFKRGSLEVVQFPALHYGWLFGNDVNAAFYTHASFIYAENIVDIPKDPELIFNILNQKIPHHWITMPCRTYEDKIRSALEETYGFDGFPLYGLDKKQEAITKYKDLLGKVKL